VASEQAFLRSFTISANCGNVIRCRLRAILRLSDRNWLRSASDGSGFGFPFLGSQAGKPHLRRTQSFCGDRVLPGVAMNPYVAVIAHPHRQRATLALPFDFVRRSLGTGRNDLIAQNGAAESPSHRVEGQAQSALLAAKLPG
jgi:hypothetical protein